MKVLSVWVLLAGLCVTWPVAALQVGGVDVPEKVTVAGYPQPLLLNGAGMRSKFFIDVYVGALYLPQPQTGVGDLLTAVAFGEHDH